MAPVAGASSLKGSLVLKIFKTKDEAIYYAWSLARKNEGDVYVDEKGKFVKQKKQRN